MLERIIGIPFSALRGVLSGRILGRVSAGTGGVEQLTPEQVRSLIIVDKTPLVFSAYAAKEWANDTAWTSAFNTTVSEHAGSLSFTPVVGDTYRVKIIGEFQGSGVSTPVMSVRAKINGTDTGLNIATGAGEIDDANGNEFEFDYTFTVQEADASAVLRDVGILRYKTGAGTPKWSDDHGYTGSLDLSGSTTIDIEMQMSTLGAAHKIIIAFATIEHIPAP